MVDVNNIDIVEANRKAVLMVEQIILLEPYCHLTEEEKMATRTNLLPHYTKIELDRALQALKEQTYLAPPPPYDPAVAAAINEQMRKLSQLQVETQTPSYAKVETHHHHVPKGDFHHYHMPKAESYHHHIAKWILSTMTTYCLPLP